MKRIQRLLAVLLSASILNVSAIRGAQAALIPTGEAGRLTEQIDSAPAEGIIGAILLVFFVLLVTNIRGLTKVFPLSRSIRSRHMAVGLDAAIAATDGRVTVRTPRSHTSLLAMLVLMLMTLQAINVRGPAPTH